tara:strand:+ start:69 stop:581 length:513 start_codon:yes stop_codon:yes gene_type:complete
MLDDDFIVIGRITSTHGVKGWVSIESYSSNKKDIFNYKLFLNNNKKFTTIDVSDYKLMPKKIILKIKNIDSIDTAETLLGYQIYTKSNQLNELDEDEYYWNKLIGCNVYTDENNLLLGKVTSIIRNISSDILVIKHKENKEEILIPFIKTYLQEVNLKEKIIKVDWENDY